MKRFIIIGVIAAVSAGGWPGIQPSILNAAPAEEKKEEPAVKVDASGNAVVHVDAETQKRIGLKVAALVAAQMTPELKGYGRVVDPGPLAALVNDWAAAQAAYSASGQELERLKKLQEQNNTSVRAVQAAEATALHDELAVQSARDRLLPAWGRELAERPDLTAFVQSLKSLESALVRIDLSAGDSLKSPPQSARLVSMSGNSVDAQFLGSALSVDPQTQGHGFLFTVKSNQGQLVPGESVTGWLRVPGPPLDGVTVPRDAVLRLQGTGWVYVQTGEAEFTRKPVALVQPTEAGWFVTNGLAAGEKLITAGAQELWSAEAKGSSKPAD